MKKEEEENETVMQYEVDQPNVTVDQPKTTTHWKGISTIIGGVLLMLYSGSSFLWGNISIYIVSYFYNFDPNTSYNFIFLVDMTLGLANWFGYHLGVYLF